MSMSDFMRIHLFQTLAYIPHEISPQNFHIHEIALTKQDRYMISLLKSRKMHEYKDETLDRCMNSSISHPRLQSFVNFSTKPKIQALECESMQNKIKTRKRWKNLTLR